MAKQRPDDQGVNETRVITGRLRRASLLQTGGHPLSRLMSIHQLALYLGVSYAAAYRLVADEHLPSVKLPGTGPDGLNRRRLVDKRDVDKLIEASKL